MVTQYAAAPPLDPLVLAELRSICLLYTSDAADERSSVDLGGRRIIKKKKSTILLFIRLYTIKKEIAERIRDH